ncbi:MAG TPA: shikimate dehydrogenase, partial [Hyphomicrobiaceae bacterium]|nr:shikimate dehydrogenase [Hyphomicrobiaceae bacterium]
RRALVVGAGGAGSSVAFALAQAGVASLKLCDPDTARVDRLIARLAEHAPGLPVVSGDADPRGFGIVANCTPVGMQPGDPLPIEIDVVDAGTIVVDVILKPEVSPMLLRARERGLVTQTGRAMLEGQVDAVLRFFGDKT